MNFNDYQAQALKTKVTNPDPQMDKTILAMGIAGEAGEVLEKWEKIVAYKKGQLSRADREELKKELGDVVWYIATFAESLGLPLEEVMQLNVSKLSSRQKRGVIKGQGDNR